MKISYELYRKGTPLSKLINDENNNITPAKIKYIGFHIARGMCFMEKNNIGHLRLTPSAIFIHPTSEDILNHTKIMVKIGKYGFMEKELAKNC